MVTENATIVSGRRDAVMDSLKVPPHSIEAEQSVLGGLMLDNEAWLEVAERVTEGDFYRRDHNEIFRAIEALANNGKPYDVVTLAEWLQNNELLETVGGLQYRAELS
jgi:replicative DNA helicase